MKYEDGFVCFATDHFSVYSVVEMDVTDILTASVTAQQQDETLHAELEVSSSYMTGNYAVVLSAYDANGCQLATAMKSVTVTESISVVSADFAACTSAVTVKAILLDGETFQPVADPSSGPCDHGLSQRSDSLHAEPLRFFAFSVSFWQKPLNSEGRMVYYIQYTIHIMEFVPVCSPVCRAPGVREEV